MLGISLGFGLMTAGIAWLAVAGGLGSLLGGTVTRTLGTGTLWVFSAALLQTIVPDRYRGRVFAVEFALLTLAQSVSTLAAGVMMDSLGLSAPEVTGVMAGAGVVATMAWLLFHWRASREWQVAVAGGKWQVTSDE
jgi:hypothetical protein